MESWLKLKDAKLIHPSTEPIVLIHVSHRPKTTEDSCEWRMAWDKPVPRELSAARVEWWWNG